MSFNAPVGRQSKTYPIDDVFETSWTAARCDTLIATLNSRFELLRKDGTQFLPFTTATKQTDGSMLGCPDGFLLKRKNRTTYAKRARRGREEANGQAWGQRTSGTSSIDAPKRAPGETWGATPFLVSSKTLDDISHPTLAPKSSAGFDAEEQNPLRNGNLRPTTFQPGPSQYQVKQALKQAKAMMMTDQYDMSMRLCESYQALLRATKKTPGPGSQPSTSLLSMCLRAMPARMKLEQELEDLEAKAADMRLVMAARNLSSEIYSEIREMDLSGQGGNHVRTILQAHGTTIIRDAIKDGLLCQEFGTVSVMNCIQMGCIHEAEILVAAMASKIQESAPISVCSQPSGSSSFLLSYIGSTAAYFRMLTGMFLHNRLPISWLATKHLLSMWPRFYASLTGDVRCQDAEEFCKVVLPLLSAASTRLPNGISVVTTFTSLLSNLCSIVLMGRSRGSLVEQSHASVMKVLQSFMIDLSRSNDYQQVYIQILVSLLIRPIEAETRDVRLPQLVAALDSDGTDHSNPVFGILLRLICSILSRCERAESGSGLRQLKLLSEVIEEVPPSSALQDLRTAMVNGISAFVQQLADGPEVAEAKNIAQTLRIRYGLSTETDKVTGFADEEGSSQTPEPKRDVAHPAGCRWEEGIGEWVAITPVSGMAEEIFLPSFSTEDEESPLVPYQKRPRSWVSYFSKRKHASTASRSQSFLDLVPSSPGGSDTEPESSRLPEIVTYSGIPLSPREDHGFRGPPRKFRKFDVSICGPSQHGRDPDPFLKDANSTISERDGLGHAYVENPFAKVKIGDSIRLRTWFPPSFRDKQTRTPVEGSMFDMESSGDELGY